MASTSNATERLNVLSRQMTSCTKDEGTGEEPLHQLLVRAPTSSPPPHSRGFMRAFPQATTMAEFPSCAHDALALDALLTPDERAVRDKARAFMEREVAPVILEYWVVEDEVALL